MTPEQRAATAVRAVLLKHTDGIPALRLDSPAGGGKTGVVERLAVQGMALCDQRCMIVTQTNEQAFDLAHRLSSRYEDLPFTLFVRKDLEVPPPLTTVRNLGIARRSRELPGGPCVVVGNAWRWSWSDSSKYSPFDFEIVDEAFQLPDHQFHQIAGMANQIFQIGDPGQIQPLVTCETERWQCDPSGPHVPAPRALLARHPDVTQLSLPISRRLPADTVEFVQPAFYPNLPFDGLCDSSKRRLITGVPETMKLDAAIDLVQEGASLVEIELPELISGEVDEDLATTIVAAIDRLVRRRAVIIDDGKEVPLRADMIGIVCAHVSQVNAIHERLPRHLWNVFVETANRFQGLEKPIMIVYHPLSGRSDADEFHLDAGRLCVMLTRHRIACLIFTQGGIEAQLLRHAPVGDRVLGMDQDTEFEGWKSNLSIMQKLRNRNRIIRLR